MKLHIQKIYKLIHSPDNGDCFNYTKLFKRNWLDIIQVNQWFKKQPKIKKR